MSVQPKILHERVFGSMVWWCSAVVCICVCVEVPLYTELVLPFCLTTHEVGSESKVRPAELIYTALYSRDFDHDRERPV